MKKLILFTCLLAAGLGSIAQDSTATGSTNRSKGSEKKQRRDAMIKQEEEGVLSYTRQNGFGIMLRTNGYGIFFEVGRRRTQRWTNTYSIELTEIKHPKEEKVPGSVFSNPLIPGKINNFYQVKLGFGQQYIFGQKGNKNGVAVIGIAQAGLSMGLLKPYYVTLRDGRSIKYSVEDSADFFSADGSSGFTKGWGELKLKPGAYIKTALRFDIGRYNETVSAIEIGMSVDAYAQAIQILMPTDSKATEAQRFFMQAHIALIFGRRK